MSRVTAVTIILTLVAACSEDVPLGGGDASPAIDAPASFTVTIGTSGAGLVVSSPAGIDCGADCAHDFVAGTSVTLVASPVGGSTFLGWTGGGCSGTGPCTVTDTAAVTAAFGPPAGSALTVARSGTGTGTVSSSPAGIACGADCSEVYPAGTVVQLVATPTAGSSFLGWSGGGCAGTGICAVVLNADTAVTATFDTVSSVLVVTKSGIGTGTVSSSPAGIGCGADCSEVYPAGTVVQLVATPTAGSSFLGWSGGGCTGTGTCAVTIAGSVNVDARFDIGSCNLTTVRGGTGLGTITSAPAGISCGSACQTPFPCGTLVTLIASPAAGSSFTGWTGAGCTGTGTCTLNVASDLTLTGNFSMP